MPVYKCIEMTTEGHDSDTCRGLERELPFSIKSFEFGDAVSRRGARTAASTLSAGSPGPRSPTRTKCMVLFLPSSSIGLTHFSAVVVSLAVALGKDESTDVHVAI